jgi:DNA-binding transcriptional LysR family regulator
MPVELVRADLSRGSLVKIVAEDAPEGFVVSVRAVYRTDAPPGIAGRWFIDRLKQGAEPAASTSSARRRRSVVKKRLRDRARRSSV